MHYVLTPVGSSGDVHPFVSIGGALRRRGHEVSLVAAAPFRAVAEGAGLRFVGPTSEEEYERATQHPDLWHTTRGPRLVFRTVARLMRDVYEATAALCEPGRTVLVGHTLSVATRVLEDQHGLPGATIHLAPNAFRSEFRQPVFRPGQDLSKAPRWLKRALWWLVDRYYVDPHIVPALNAWRAEIGLPPVERIFRSWLHSPRRVIGLFPEWFGPPQPDWPPQLRLTGFPLFDEADQRPIDPALEAFLEGGEPPIVFTPGSANRQVPAFFRAAIEACGLLGRRALLLTPYPEQIPEALPAGVLHAPYAPFSRVLPRCAAIVHHGGVGTCAQGLAAGIPQLVMPLAFDQPDNAARLSRLGVGAWIKPRRFTPRRAAGALRRLTGSGETARACRRYREATHALDAVERTCDLLEAL